MSHIEFHVPSGVLLEMNGQTQLRYVTFLEVGTSDLMHEHILTLFDAHAEAWAKTTFSGDVKFQCWNDMLEPENAEGIADTLREILASAQRVIDSNHITSADGNRVVLRASLSKLPNDANDET